MVPVYLYEAVLPRLVVQVTNRRSCSKRADPICPFHSLQHERRGDVGDLQIR